MPIVAGWRACSGAILNSFATANLVAFGDNFAATRYIYTSPDGVTWTSRTVPAITANFACANVKYDFATAAVYLAATSNGQLIRSVNDGVTWAIVAAPPTALTYVYRIINWSGTFYLLGVSAGLTVIWSSPDGLTWTKINHDLPVNTYGYQEFCYNGSIWVVSDDLGDKTWYSYNGTHFHESVNGGGMTDIFTSVTGVFFTARGSIKASVDGNYWVDVGWYQNASRTFYNGYVGRLVGVSLNASDVNRSWYSLKM
jgi:hypothetical protein